jgi:hypothetical protein
MTMTLTRKRRIAVCELATYRCWGRPGLRANGNSQHRITSQWRATNVQMPGRCYGNGVLAPGPAKAAIVVTADENAASTSLKPCGPDCYRRSPTLRPYGDPASDQHRHGGPE